MDFNAGLGDFATWIAAVLRATLSESDDSYAFEIGRQNSHKLILSKSRLGNVVGALRKFEVTDETTIWEPKSYEVLLRDESAFPRLRIMMRRESALQIRDDENGLLYTLSRPSEAYLLFLLNRAAAIGGPAKLAVNLAAYRMADEIDADTDIFDFLRHYFGRFITLRIESDRNRSSADFDRFSTAILFQLSYNLDTALVPQRHLDEIMRAGRITALRRAPNPREIDPPRRFYIPDLVHHYQLAVAGDNPFLEFLSYYHVMEHFFEVIFMEDLVERIRQKITQPSFSYKRRKDISALVRDISKSLQIRSERITFNEQEALRLTLDRYLDVDSLLSQLDQYDATLVPYYADSRVVFANADSVALGASDRDSIIKSLSSRIYRVRNSIVHSKESEKTRFVPFRDDRTLLKEIPLLRFAAEQIIIATSTLL